LEIANATKRRARVLLILVSYVRGAAGHPPKKTSGLVPAGMNGTRSILEACAPPASTNGLRRNASRAPTGRHTQNGMCSNALTSGSKPHTAAKPKPRAMRVHVVVPSIHSREVSRAQRSGVRHGEDALCTLD